jgi:hypothetical protein
MQGQHAPVMLYGWCMQGQLADYNLIVDKLRTNAEPSDIAQQ